MPGRKSKVVDGELISQLRETQAHWTDMKYPNVLDSYNATILKRQEEGNYEFDTICKTTLYKWRKDTNYQDPFIGNDEVDDEELYRLVREYYEDMCDDNETDRGRTAFEGYLRSQGFHIHRDRQRAAVKDLYPEVAHYPLPELTLWSQWVFFYPFFRLLYQIMLTNHYMMCL